METLACLCNLSLCGCIGENPLSFLDAVDVKNLIAFLCSADSTYRLFGAVTIGNIVSAIPLQDKIVSGGALAPLVTVANAADLEDAETGEVVELDTGKAKVRDEYRDRAVKRREEMTSAIRGSGVDFLEIVNGVDWMPALMNFFRTRRSKA